MIDKLIWRDIPGFEGDYQASVFGEIRSVNKTIIRSNGRTYKRECKILKPAPYQGWLKCALSFPGSKNPYTTYVHRLVAMAWIGERPDGLTVDHIDGNKKNNAAWNLEYVTQSENCRRSFVTGCQKPKRGELNGMNKISTETAKTLISIMDENKKNGVQNKRKEICELYNTTETIFKEIQRGRAWKHLKQIST